MFTLKMHHNNPACAITVSIDGCPEEGLAAVDFRRAHGLAEAPCEFIDLTPATLVDEAAARLLPLNAAADFEPLYQFRQSVALTGGRVDTRYPSNGGRSNHPRISADAIRNWQAEQTPANALALYASVQEIDRRERDKAAAILAAELLEKERKDAAIEAARELLADELGKLRARVNYLEGELKEAHEKIDQLESAGV